MTLPEAIRVLRRFCGERGLALAALDDAEAALFKCALALRYGQAAQTPDEKDDALRFMANAESDARAALGPQKFTTVTRPR